MGEENENFKGEENKKEKKDGGAKAIKGAGGEEDETDNNDQGLDDMNFHDEGVENDKGGDDEEEQNDKGGVEGKNIEGKNAKKGEGRTELIGTNDVHGKEFNNTKILNDEEVNSAYDKSLKEYKDQKEKSMMPSYDLNISQLTPPDMKENIGEEEKDKGKKEVVKDVPNPKRESQPTIQFMISKNQNKESLPEVTENQNITQQPRQQRKNKTYELMRSPYKERAICLKTKLTTEEEMFGEWLFNLQGIA
ncbi:unnamed protein product [Lactuca saligna]|uniref:Uncharacterized protein n=1 Tax=Lactuca saligna TaxID=75948 RepID=A0AA35VYH2_LACSI|nr:unnamed protein product [Lactuca saligna]